ncbi:hypothetical protein [Nocardiopsis metallicus]|uniref:Uncharacterized protein n=1 Tax=Nocardiopsis metallicus TaxID=179819 RepID=A0A840W1X5_9ACTN|nr:hypothetical protein [Nocardiopsis metallicus]MBB5490870.1 hypothetical protein [Nocardiopsis metallicus]
MTLLVLLAGALLVCPLLSPTAAQASAPRDESGALEDFYARMLEEHEGVFIEEELAGVLDRHEVAEDLRAQLAEHEYRNNVLVVGDPPTKCTWTCWPTRSPTTSRHRSWSSPPTATTWG